MDKQENAIRTILKNEVTWIVTILTAGWACVHWIILPLNTIQLQIAGLTADISAIKGYDARITENANDIIVLQQEFKNISTKQ